MDIDISKIPTPAYLVDERLIKKNMEVMKKVCKGIPYTHLS